MRALTVLLDANVLFSAPIRDVFLQLALSGIFRVKWSERIHHEWKEALMRNQPRRDRAALERTHRLMNENFRDSLVDDYESLIPKLELPDPGDRHVLAAAITGRCDVIVTRNLRHFPQRALRTYRLEALNPDTVLSRQLELAPISFCAAVRKVRTRLINPPYEVGEYLTILEKVGLTETAAILTQRREHV